MIPLLGLTFLHVNLVRMPWGSVINRMKRKKTPTHVIIIASFALCTQWSLKNHGNQESVRSQSGVSQLCSLYTVVTQKSKSGAKIWRTHIVHILDPRKNWLRKICIHWTVVIVQLMQKSPTKLYIGKTPCFKFGLSVHKSGILVLSRDILTYQPKCPGYNSWCKQMFWPSDFCSANPVQLEFTYSYYSSKWLIAFVPCSTMSRDTVERGRNAICQFQCWTLLRMIV